MLKVSLPDKGYKARLSQASMLTLYYKLLPLNRIIIQNKPETVKSNSPSVPSGPVASRPVVLKSDQ
jgi:hypothetical protein